MSGQHDRSQSPSQEIEEVESSLSCDQSISSTRNTHGHCRLTDTQRVWVLCCLFTAIGRLNLPQTTNRVDLQLYNAFCPIFLKHKEIHGRNIAPARKNVDTIFNAFMTTGRFASHKNGGRSKFSNLGIQK